MEAGGRRREIIMKYFGLNEEPKDLSKIGYKEEAKTEGEPEAIELSPEERKNYPALAAKVNYIAQDNPCI